MLFKFDNHYSDETYRERTQRYLAYLAMAFGFFSVVLTAMQVAQGTKLAEKNAFVDNTYRFSYFSMMAPIVVLSYVMLMPFGKTLATFYGLWWNNYGEKRRAQRAKQDTQKFDDVERASIPLRDQQRLV